MCLETLAIGHAPLLLHLNAAPQPHASCPPLVRHAAGARGRGAALLRHPRGPRRTRAGRLGRARGTAVELPEPVVPLEWSKYSCVHQGQAARAAAAAGRGFAPAGCALGGAWRPRGNGTRVFFWGDSLLRQVFIAMACGLHAAGRVVDAAADWPPCGAAEWPCHGAALRPLRPGAPASSAPP